jgi:hypothetical protein
MNRSIGCASGEEPYTPSILWALIGARASSIPGAGMTTAQGGDHDNCIRGVEISGTNGGRSARILQRMRGAQPVKGQPISTCRLLDDNGPKGNRAIRCALTVRLPYRTRPPEHTAEPHGLPTAASPFSSDSSSAIGAGP